MISQEEEKMIEAMGWTLVCHSPMEMEHTDGSTATGVHTCKLVIKDTIEEYHEMKRQEAIEAERAKKAEATKSLNLESINGREIIDFLDSVRMHDEEEYELYDCSVSGFKFDSQSIRKVTKGEHKYILNFTGVFNNWGHDQDEPGQEIIITKSGVQVRLGEPFEGDGSEEAIEEILTKWLKTHTFSNDSEEKFDAILREAYETLGGVGFGNKEELQTVIEKLEDAYTYMK
jgi:hypothetical protein